MLYAGKVMPSSLEDATVAVNDKKKFLMNTIPNTGRDEWTVKALREVIWEGRAEVQHGLAERTGCLPT